MRLPTIILIANFEPNGDTPVRERQEERKQLVTQLEALRDREENPVFDVTLCGSEGEFEELISRCGGYRNSCYAVLTHQVNTDMAKEWAKRFPHISFAVFGTGLDATGFNRYNKDVIFTGSPEVHRTLLSRSREGITPVLLADFGTWRSATDSEQKRFRGMLERKLSEVTDDGGPGVFDVERWETLASLQARVSELGSATPLHVIFTSQGNEDDASALCEAFPGISVSMFGMLLGSGGGLNLYPQEFIEQPDLLRALFNRL